MGHRRVHPAQEEADHHPRFQPGFRPGGRRLRSRSARPWAGDITYIPTWEGFLYLAAVEDLGSRRILGVSMASHMRAELVCDALGEACGLRGGDVAGSIFHSDKGAQYTSGNFADLCEDYGIARSVGRTGICWDNAAIESWFATLKKELVYRRTFRTRAEARLAIRAWIAWYNTRRTHSTLSYLTPTEWEDNHYRHSINTGTKTA
ncbi:MAG: IS3 family transposase [Gemmatimonadales bacterium]